MQFSLSLAQTVIYISYIITAFSLPAGGAENFFQHVSNYSLPSYIIYAINVSQFIPLVHCSLIDVADLYISTLLKDSYWFV